jgi:hypothetical protein
MWAGRTGEVSEVQPHRLLHRKATARREKGERQPLRIHGCKQGHDMPYDVRRYDASVTQAARGLGDGPGAVPGLHPVAVVAVGHTTLKGRRTGCVFVDARMAGGCWG